MQVGNYCLLMIFFPFVSTAREKAINDLMAYSLLCGCCCYSCCVRTKLRKNFNIEVSSSQISYCSHFVANS